MVIETVPDWRRLFDAMRIEWRDKGPNVGRNRINIKCPWCSAVNPDPSYHLSISETSLVYVCARSPNQHKGGHRPDMIRLLMQLGETRISANMLLDTYKGSLVASADQTGITHNAVTRQWNIFTPAVQSSYIMNYLRHERGFPDAEIVAQRYDLRFTPYGEWAARLLIPLVDDKGNVISWTGRSLTTKISPRYKMQDVLDERGLVYIGREPRSTSLIVEGPIDALKINAACEHLPISAAALTGLSLPGWSSPGPDRLKRIRNFLRGAQTRLIAPDASVSVEQVKRMRITIAEFQGPGYNIYHLPILPPFNDPGAMDYISIRKWITEYIDTMGKTDAQQRAMHSTIPPKPNTSTSPKSGLHPRMGQRYIP